MSLAPPLGPPAAERLKRSASEEFGALSHNSSRSTSVTAPHATQPGPTAKDTTPLPLTRGELPLLVRTASAATIAASPPATPPAPSTPVLPAATPPAALRGARTQRLPSLLTITGVATPSAAGTPPAAVWRASIRFHDQPMVAVISDLEEAAAEDAVRPLPLGPPRMHGHAGRTLHDLSPRESQRASFTAEEEAVSPESSSAADATQRGDLGGSSPSDNGDGSVSGGGGAGALQGRLRRMSSITRLRFDAQALHMSIAQGSGKLISWQAPKAHDDDSSPPSSPGGSRVGSVSSSASSLPRMQLPPEPTPLPLLPATPQQQQQQQRQRVPEHGSGVQPSPRPASDTMMFWSSQVQDLEPKASSLSSTSPHFHRRAVQAWASSSKLAGYDDEQVVQGQAPPLQQGSQPDLLAPQEAQMSLSRRLERRHTMAYSRDGRSEAPRRAPAHMPPRRSCTDGLAGDAPHTPMLETSSMSGNGDTYEHALQQQQQQVAKQRQQPQPQQPLQQQKQHRSSGDLRQLAVVARLLTGTREAPHLDDGEEEGAVAPGVRSRLKATALGVQYKGPETWVEEYERVRQRAHKVIGNAQGLNWNFDPRKRAAAALRTAQSFAEQGPSE